jgi:hypothetical protein
MIRLARDASPMLLVIALLFAGEAAADDQDCAKREAIAASIAKVESETPAGRETALLAEIESIEKQLAELHPVLFGTCPENLGIAILSGRLQRARDVVREAVAQAQRRQERALEQERLLKERQAEQERRRQEQEHLRRAEEQRRREIAAKPWSEPIKQAVIARKIQIGMTSEQVAAAWGRPSTVNETIRATSREEQWVYESTYLYFMNGTLTTIQRTR